MPSPRDRLLATENQLSWKLLEPLWIQAAQPAPVDVDDPGCSPGPVPLADTHEGGDPRDPPERHLNSIRAYLPCREQDRRVGWHLTAGKSHRLIPDSKVCQILMGWTVDRHRHYNRRHTKLAKARVGSRGAR